MNRFSLFEYDSFPDNIKDGFKRAFAERLSVLESDVVSDDVIGTDSIIEFITSLGTCQNADEIVSSLYSSISGGIQAGSGNQVLFSNILNIMSGCWREVNNY